MKNFKKIASVLLCIALIASCFVGCHQKGATVATLKGEKSELTVPSGVYLTMLINADSDARSKVSENLSDDKKSDDIDFSKQTVKDDDGKEYKFYDYVKKMADEMCKTYLTTRYYFEKFGLKLDEEDENSLNNYISYQWYYTGGNYLYEANGASLESFTQFMRVYAYERSEIFDYLYGEGGEKAPSKDKLAKGLEENFVVADVIEMKTTDDEGNALADDDLTAVETKLQGYCDRINGGEDFAVINDEYKAETETEGEKAEGTETAEDDGTPKPKDPLASVYGTSDTTVASNLTESFLKAEVGKAEVIKGDDGYYRLVLRKDVNADPYYFDTYRDETARILYSDEFEKYMDGLTKDLDIKYNSYEINYLKPKKIDYTEYQTWYANAYGGMAG